MPMKLQHMSEAIWIGVRHVEEIHLGTGGLQRGIHGLGCPLTEVIGSKVIGSVGENPKPI